MTGVRSILANYARNALMMRPKNWSCSMLRHYHKARKIVLAAIIYSLEAAEHPLFFDISLTPYCDSIQYVSTHQLPRCGVSALSSYSRYATETQRHRMELMLRTEQ